MNITADITAQPPDLKVRVAVANIGDEQAHDLQITLQDGAETSTPRVDSLLRPNASFEVESNLGIGAPMPGRYPLFVTVRYSDANGYPFSAILCATYFVGKDSASEMFGIMDTEPLEEVGQLHLQLKNVADEEIILGVRIFAPREISVGDYREEVQLSPKREVSLDVPISNFSALPGSRYPVYGVVEYEKRGLHYTNVIPAQIEIIASVSFFTRYRLWMVSFAGILFLIGILSLMIRNRLLSVKQRQ